MKKAAIIMALIGIMMLSALSAQETRATKTIEISPNPMTQFAEITVVLGYRAEIRVTIENSARQVVKTLFTGSADQNLVLRWEGTDEDGKLAPVGEYEVVVYQGRYTSTKKTLILK
ncbi:MAG: hypothetical protein KBA54_01740 [Candidatus Cloacimonetes bacterium]|jgi:flagellar hook assembly protein FlgD|nr:hypothetical protein [Candidatus Cloacimonadota bacterium]